jgi:Asp-tRNA(Asn)/Glu-tRNA(Gln) amidotransferase A subunit family amidase
MPSEAEAKARAKVSARRANGDSSTGNWQRALPVLNRPIGMHFVGGYGDEAALFRLAAQLERAKP